MENKMAALSRPKVLWLQVGGLATVQAATSLSWIIYRIYLPQLLAQFGLPGLDKTIALIEDSFAVFLEPIAGSLSDRARIWIGTRFPFIALGIILASAFFIAIPAIFIFGSPTGVLQWLLPAVLVLWALAMALFRSPVMALLGQYAAVPELPQAGSILVLIGSLVGALRPLAGNYILGLGAGATFTIGSLALLGSAAALRAVNPQAAVNPNPEASRQMSLPMLVLIFILGACVAWGFRLAILDITPKLLAGAIPVLDKRIADGILGILLGIFSVIAGAIASRWSNRRLMAIGAGATVLMLGLLLASRGILVAAVAIALVACFSLLWNGAVPLVISLMPSDRIGLGIGIYFSGFTSAMILFSQIFTAPIAPNFGAILAAIAILAAGSLTALSSSRQFLKRI